MKRLCFDTESNYYKSPISGIGSVEAHQEYFRDQHLRFDCGVVFEELTGEYHEFDNQQVAEFVAMLKSADELISHSGPRVDLIVLEHACGEDCIAPLRQLTHHDLFDMCNWSSLDTLAKKYVPDRVPTWAADYESRCKLAEDSFIAKKLAKARFDVERTYAVFLELYR